MNNAVSDCVPPKDDTYSPPLNTPSPSDTDSSCGKSMFRIHP